MAAQTYPVAVICQASRPDSAAGLATRQRRSHPPGGEGAVRTRSRASAGISGTCGIVPSESMRSPDDAARASRARLIKAQAEAQEMENAKNPRGFALRRPWSSGLGAEMAASFEARILSIPEKAAPQVVWLQFHLRRSKASWSR